MRGALGFSYHVTVHTASLILPFILSHVPPNHLEWCSNLLLASWFKGFEKTGNFSNFPECTPRSNLISLEELCSFSFQILRAPFQGCFANTSLRGHSERCWSAHPFTSQGLGFPICKVGMLGQVNGFRLVPVKSSEEAPRFKTSNGRVLQVSGVRALNPAHLINGPHHPTTPKQEFLSAFSTPC